MKPCKCKNFACVGPESFSVHHHVSCPKYKTEKNPFLFYYEDAINGWIPAPEKIENIIGVEDMDELELFEIKFKRVDMTDEQFDNLPEE